MLMNDHKLKHQQLCDRQLSEYSSTRDVMKLRHAYLMGRLPCSLICGSVYNYALFIILLISFSLLPSPHFHLHCTVLEQNCKFYLQIPKVFKLINVSNIILILPNDLVFENAFQIQSKAFRILFRVSLFQMHTLITLNTYFIM